MRSVAPFRRLPIKESENEEPVGRVFSGVGEFCPRFKIRCLNPRFVRRMCWYENSLNRRCERFAESLAFQKLGDIFDRIRKINAFGNAPALLGENEHGLTRRNLKYRFAEKCHLMEIRKKELVCGLCILDYS